MQTIPSRSIATICSNSNRPSPSHDRDRNLLKIKNPAYNRNDGREDLFHPHHKSNELTWRALNEARAALSGTAVCSVVSSLKEVTGKENGMTGLRLTDSTCYAQVLSDLHTALDIPSQGPPLKDILGVSRGVIGE